MEADVWVFLEPAVALLMGVEIVEDDVQFVVRKGGNVRFMKPRNSRPRHRLECAAMICLVATSAA
jgi:hypothetical protein